MFHLSLSVPDIMNISVNITLTENMNWNSSAKGIPNSIVIAHIIMIINGTGFRGGQSFEYERYQELYKEYNLNLNLNDPIPQNSK